jgi:VanZ family protein
MNKLRVLWLGLGWLWVLAIIYLSLMPNPPEPVRFWGADKLEHALAYGLLMLWFCQIYRRGRARLLLAFMLVTMGIVLEFVQRETGLRFFEYVDMLANAAGVIVGWAWARTRIGRVFAYLEYHSVRTSKLH